MPNLWQRRLEKPLMCKHVIATYIACFRYWGSIKCQDYTKPTTGQTSLELENVAGIFMILMGGIAFSVLIGLMTFLYNRSRR